MNHRFVTTSLFFLLLTTTIVWTSVQAKIVVTSNTASSSGSATTTDDNDYYGEDDKNTVPSPTTTTVTANTAGNIPQMGGTIKASATASGSTTTVEGVLELTSLNMDQYFRDGSLWLVEFYAPWCHHCNAFAPTYAQVAYELHSANNNNNINSPQKQKSRKIRVAKVNGEQERAARSRFNIQGYPVFFLVDGWTVYKYEASRTQENLVRFAQGGYKLQNSLPIWSSPMGPMGQVQAFMFYISGLFVSCYSHLTLEWGLSPAVAASVFALGSLTVALVTMITVAILLTVKVKED